MFRKCFLRNKCIHLFNGKEETFADTHRFIQKGHKKVETLGYGTKVTKKVTK